MNREQLRADLVSDEGLKLKPYRCTAGKLTIGVGRNIEDVGISQDEAFTLLDHDIDRVMAQLTKELPWWVTRPESVQRALANMAFQLGINGLLAFNKTLACLQAGDYQGAQNHARDSAWAKQTPVRAERVIGQMGDV